MCDYDMTPTFISTLFMFLFRYGSLSQFVKEFRYNEVGLNNLNKYFFIQNIPSDDQIRYILKFIPTDVFNVLLKKIHVYIERKKYLNSNLFLQKWDLLCADGSGMLSSYNIFSDKYLTRKTDDKTLYMHSQFMATLTDINGNYSLPLAFEPIENNGVIRDYQKNDCELNAAKRLFIRIRESFPKRNFCILADNLFGVEPIVLLLRKLHFAFIITAKPERNKELFFWFDYLKEKQNELVYFDKNNHRHAYLWMNTIPLTQKQNAKDYVYTNLLKYWEYDCEGNLIYHNSWITDFTITKDNARQLAKGGRIRFIIENKTFNDQKQRGFHVEHNYGHAENLPNVFFGLAQIAHLFSQLFCLWKLGKESTQLVGNTQRFFIKLSVLMSEIDLPFDNAPILRIKFVLDTS